MAIEHTTYYRTSAAPHPRFARASGRRETATCIIGGGYAGLNTALGLAERGARDVVLLESREVAFGASGRNGGFVFGGFSANEQTLLRDLGPARARALYQGTQDAVDLIRARIAKYRIACDHTDSGVLWANWFDDDALLHARHKLMVEQFGVDWQFIDRLALRDLILSDRYRGALFEPNALHFHPLNYALGIAAAAAEQGVCVYENSPAIDLQRRGAGWRVRTPEAEIDCEHVVLTCGGYLAGLRRDVDASVLPIATYVMVTEPLGARMQAALQTRAAIYDTRFAFDYYRPLPDSRLLWGGRISVLDRSPDAVKRLLYRDMLKVFPQLQDVAVDSAWSGLMSYARHEMPQIGQIDDGLWVAQAFGGHGVAPTTFAGEVLASAIADGDLRWKEFAGYGLRSTWKPAGFVAAQLSYWWLQARDAWKSFR